MMLNLLRRGAIGFVLFVLFGTLRATAGPVYLYLAIDPPTTAGAGIGTVPRQFSNGTFSVTSTLSGAGKWHLYALDDLQGSLGLAGFSVTVSNSSGIFNRSPFANYTNYGDADENVIDSIGSAGFSDTLVRSGQGSNPPNPVQANQVIGSLQGITGFGSTASNFNNVPNNPAPGDHRVWGGITSGVWGNYATTPTSAGLAAAGYVGAANAMEAGKKWIFLGEGQYTGGAPTMAATAQVNYYDGYFNSALHMTPVTPAKGGITRIVIIPEPASIVFVGLAMACFGFVRRRPA